MLQAILNDENWFPVVTPLALLAVAVFVILTRRRGLPAPVVVTNAFNLFWGLWIGIMGAGHIFAVTTKTVLGILRPDIGPWTAIPFGLAIAVPGWWLVAGTKRLNKGDESARPRSMRLNGWLAAWLVIPAWPLVISPVLNLVLLARGGRKPAALGAELR